ncbi:hypothetical protein ACHAPU_011514 [Fusarium lateritium]
MHDHSLLVKARDNFSSILNKHKEDLNNVLSIITNNQTAATVSYAGQGVAWSLNLSLADWFLQVVKFADFDLHACDNPVLYTLRQEFLRWPLYQDLRDLVDRKGMEVALEESIDDRRVKQIKGFLEYIAKSASLLCATPHTIRSKPYHKVADAAKAVILDEAGAMHKADAIMVIGDYLRPTVMAGDPKQLPPTVMSASDRFSDSTYVNAFALHGRVSILEHVQRTGHACFVL